MGRGLERAGAAEDRGRSSWLATFSIFGLSMLLAGLTWLIGFGSALHVAPPGPAWPADAPESFSRFGEVWRLVDAEFYGELPLPRDVTSGAISGLLESLDDPYAAYLSRDAAAEARARFSPSMAEGIGAWIEPVLGGARVLATLPDSPARRAGLEPGDRLIALDEVETAGLDTAALQELLDGPVGSSLSLLVQTDSGPPRSLELVRARFDQPAVDFGRPAEDLAYLRLARVDAAVLPELDSALQGLAALPTRALVLDLRDNPGGELESARQLAGRFFTGVAWRQVDAGGRVETRMSDPDDAPHVDLPAEIVVLINGGTASAAEMLAGALREALGAVLIGEPSFGKAEIQGLVPLSDGSFLRLTVARWTTASGVSVAGSGLLPDIAIEDAGLGADLDHDAALGAALDHLGASAALEGS